MTEDRPMTGEEAELVHKITLRHLSGIDKDDAEKVDEIRGAIHADLFEDERLTEISAADLSEEADCCIHENGWRSY